MATSKKKAKATSARWLGCFSVEGVDEEYTSFQMLADAADVDAAVQGFRARLKELAKESTLFDRGGDVILEYVLDVSGPLLRPALVNMVSGKPAPEGFVFCGVPEQPDSTIEMYGQGDEDADRYEPEPLITFKPKARRASTKAPKATKASAKPKRKA